MQKVKAERLKGAASRLPVGEIQGNAVRPFTAYNQVAKAYPYVAWGLKIMAICGGFDGQLPYKE
jgi:hypothetical protein